MMTAMIIGGLVAGGISAISSAKNRKVQAEETKRQLEQRQIELDAGRNNLTESYDLAIRQNREMTQEANELIGLQAQQTEAARDFSLKTSAQGSAMSDQLASNQIAALQVEASQAEGQAVQSAATSGMRNTGSALNVIKDTSSKGARSLSQAMLQRNISRFSDHASARANYLNAENQLTLYQEQIKSNEANLRRYEEEAGMKYRQSMDEIGRAQNNLNADISFLNSSEYRSAQAWGYASDIFGGISTGLNFASGIQNVGTAFGWKPKA